MRKIIKKMQDRLMTSKILTVISLNKAGMK